MATLLRRMHYSQLMMYAKFAIYLTVSAAQNKLLTMEISWDGKRKKVLQTPYKAILLTKTEGVR